MDARGDVVGAAPLDTRVRVSVRLPTGTPLPAHGRVRVSVEDVSRADAAAPQVVAGVFPVAPPSRGERVLGPFELTARLPPGRDYALRVHVDRSGDGHVAPGDLVSAARHTVTAGHAELEVPVETVADAPPAARG